MYRHEMVFFHYKNPKTKLYIDTNESRWSTQILECNGSQREKKVSLQLTEQKYFQNKKIKNGEKEE